MSPEDRKLLEKTYDLAQENSKMLSKMYRSQIVGRFVKVLYWIVIIALSGFALTAIQPYMQQLQGLAGGINNAGNGASSNYVDMIKELTK